MAQQAKPLIKTAPRLNTLRLTRDADVLIDVIHAWHDDEHTDPWPFCMEQPCHAAQEFVDDAVAGTPAYR